MLNHTQKWQSQQNCCFWSELLCCWHLWPNPPLQLLLPQMNRWVQQGLQAATSGAGDLLVPAVHGAPPLPASSRQLSRVSQALVIPLLFPHPKNVYSMLMKWRSGIAPLRSTGVCTGHTWDLSGETSTSLPYDALLGITLSPTPLTHFYSSNIVHPLGKLFFIW